MIWLIVLECWQRGLLLLAAGRLGVREGGLEFRRELRRHRQRALRAKSTSTHIDHSSTPDREARPTGRYELKLFGAEAIGYGLLELIEREGLFYRERWAERLTVVAAWLIVPLEAYELARHPSWLKAIGVAVNVAIVG